MSSPVGADLHTIADLLREQLPADMIVTGRSAVMAASRPWNAQVSGCPAVVGAVPRHG
jgi:hypothetical protein